MNCHGRIFFNKKSGAPYSTPERMKQQDISNKTPDQDTNPPGCYGSSPAFYRHTLQHAGHINYVYILCMAYRV